MALSNQSPEPGTGQAIPWHAARMTFGRFVVLPSSRTLLRDGVPVCIGARAFDLLVVLLAFRGRVVGKDEIFRHVWPTTTVDESNLRFQMTLLRKALGGDRDFIKTIPGRGYILAVDACPASASMPIWPAAVQTEQNAVGEALATLLRTLTRYPDASAALDRLLAVAGGGATGDQARGERIDEWTH